MGLRKIILHGSAVDRHDKFRDAGETLTVGAADNDDSDLTTDRAQDLLDNGRAVSLADAAEEAKAPPIDPLDHDGDGAKGGSLSGEQSTRARARAKPQEA